MAEIYLARQRGLEGVERTVVLKRILERYAHDPEFVTMFLDEARLLAALSHPNIAQVFDVGKIGATYYLVMEHVRGPTLGRLLTAARKAGQPGLARREALGIALGIAEALHYAHERRDEHGRPLDIVHRDLNPANVMVSYDGGVKLIDFGIAKAATKVYETRSGVIKGTYGYIAPEQLVGTSIVDRRADVFALGILLYEMCVGVHPYDASDEPDLVDRILQARYRRPRQVRPDIPVELDRLIASCLAPHPEGRPADMAALIDALAAHLGEQRLVPTQTGVAAMARALVPDEEGPRPLPRLAIEHRRQDGREPSGTVKVRLDDGKPRTPPPRLADPLSDVALTLSASQPLDIDPSHDEPTTPSGPLAPSAPMADDDEEPTTRRVSVPPGAPRAEPLPPPLRRTPEAGVPTWVPPPPAQRPSPFLVVPLALTGILGAGLAGFFTVRVLDDAPPEPPPLEARSTEPALRTLRVVSEPAGAEVNLDGRRAGLTPVGLTVPATATTVWLRVSRSGYADEEREVSATAGEARFVLTRSALDAGPPDAGVGLDSGVDAGRLDEERPRPRRRVRRRR
jgi:serine/threonine protein kinase